MFIFGRRQQALEMRRFNATSESKRPLTNRLLRASPEAHCRFHLKRRSGLLMGSPEEFGRILPDSPAKQYVRCP